MKKIIPAILALFLSAATLVGCGLSMPSGSDNSPSGGSENSSTTDNNSTDENSTGGSTGGNSGSTGDNTGGSTGGSTGGGSGDSELPDDGGEDTPQVDAALETLKAAYALNSGSSLSGTHTLTGVVTDVERTGQGDICLTFVVGEYTQYPMYCYWLQDADMVKVGYTITVSGTIKNYNGKVEFDHPTLVNYSSNGSGGNTGDSGNTGGSTGGNTGGTDESLLTNDGAGLPTDADGVYAVDLTKGKYAKNVTEQGYYLGGCPTVGKPQVLVVPVQFSDVTAASKGYDVQTIKNAFNGDVGTTDYRSVHDYYYTSSYGKLDIQFTVLDSWFTPKYNSSYYLNATMDYYGEQVECGDQMVIDEILASLEGKMDLSDFDSDNNELIDAVVVINTLEINSDVTMQWAY